MTYDAASGAGSRAGSGSAASPRFRRRHVSIRFAPALTVAKFNSAPEILHAAAPPRGAMPREFTSGVNAGRQGLHNSCLHYGLPLH